MITSELDTTYTSSKVAEYAVLEDAGAAKRYSDHAVEGAVFTPCACVERRVADMSTFVDVWLAYQTF
jgi:hypothetical protein